MKLIKTRLLMEKVRITNHAIGRMKKRGYTKSDLISCIFTGTITKKQNFAGKIRFVIEGTDTDRLPIIIVVSKDLITTGNLAVVTVFPPLKNNFKRVV